MSRKALDDHKYETIKAYILEPDNSLLSDEHQEIMDRVISLTIVLDKNPIQKQAIAIHQAKYPDLSRTQAYEDSRLAVRLFNTIHNFSFDFWQTWLRNDIVRNIEKCRNNGTPQALKVVAMEHANRIKALGERPEELEDPRRTKKYNFYVLIQNNHNTVKLDMTQLENLPSSTIKELNVDLFGRSEIIDSQIEELINS